MIKLLSYHTSSQPVADQMLALLPRPDDPALDAWYRRALVAIGHLESASWYPQAFADALGTAPGEFSFNNIGRLQYEPDSVVDPAEVYEAVAGAIVEYLKLIAPSEQPQYMTAKEAAEYLGISLDILNHHILRTKRIPVHHTVGRTRMISREVLDAFKAEGIPSVGRPANS